MAARNVSSTTAGVVASVEKRVGDAVAVDEVVLVIECMKVEIPIVAPMAGRLTRLAVAVGDTVAEQQVIFAIQP